MGWEKHDLKQHDFELIKDGYLRTMPSQDILVVTFTIYRKEYAKKVQVKLAYTGEDNDEEEVDIVNGKLVDIWRKPEKINWISNTHTLKINGKEYIVYREDDRKKERNIAPALFHYQDIFKTLPRSVQAAMNPFYEGHKLAPEQIIERSMADAEHAFVHGLYRTYVYGLGRWAKPEDVAELGDHVHELDRRRLLRSL